MQGEASGLEVCGSCGAYLVEAEQWARLAADYWWFRLVCPECGWLEELIAERKPQPSIEALTTAVPSTLQAHAARRQHPRGPRRVTGPRLSPSAGERRRALGAMTNQPEAHAACGGGFVLGLPAASGR